MASFFDDGFESVFVEAEAQRDDVWRDAGNWAGSREGVCADLTNASAGGVESSTWSMLFTWLALVLV